jgi:hypothetical protein
VVLDAAVEVMFAARLPLGVSGGVQDALAVELEPGNAAGDARLRRGRGDLLLEVLERGLELRFGCVAQGGGVVEGRPDGEVGPGRDDHGLGAGECGRLLRVAMAHDVEDEEADDDGEKDEVAGAKLHGVSSAGPASPYLC